MAGFPVRGIRLYESCAKGDYACLCAHVDLFVHKSVKFYKNSLSWALCYCSMWVQNIYEFLESSEGCS